MAYSQILLTYEICADCQFDCRKQTDLFGHETEHDLYRIIDRETPTDKFFCSLACIDSYLLYRQPGWKVVGVQACTAGHCRTIHFVGIERDGVFKPYNDRIS